MRTLVSSLHEGLLGVLQGTPCCVGQELGQVPEDNFPFDERPPRHSIGEVNIADIASPQRQRRRQAEAWALAQNGSPSTVSPSGQYRRSKSKSPGGQTHRLMAKALKAEPMPSSKMPNINEEQLSVRSSPSQGAQRSIVVSQSCGHQGADLSGDGGFLDDVRLRSDAVRPKHGVKPGRASPAVLLREKCDFSLDEMGETATARGSTKGDRACESPDGEENVILDLSNILQACPADGSVLGNSLDESMMGANAMDDCDENIEDNPLIRVPDLPEARLGECRRVADVQPAAPAPNRTVSFPAPPQAACNPIYHKGHYQGWSQRKATRSLSPRVLPVGC